MYTDTDVLFADDFDLAGVGAAGAGAAGAGLWSGVAGAGKAPPSGGTSAHGNSAHGGTYTKLRNFAAGSEVFSPSLNTGVMFMNVSAVRSL